MSNRSPLRARLEPVACEPVASEVFLLGAGFSRAISRSMPLLQDLAAHLAERYGESGHVGPEVQALMDENLAHALSYLEQAKPWLTEAENLRHRALFLEFSSIIADVLEEICDQLMQNSAAASPDWLRALILSWHQSRCTVLTLNYDTLIESAAAGSDLGGESKLAAQHLYPPLLTDAGLRSGAAAPVRRLETFRLLKLHGSTNWYYSGRASAQGEPIYFVPPPPDRAAAGGDEDHALRMRAVADKYPFLVPPIYDKSALFTHETIRALWFQAGEALKQAERVVCMGYSLPESDLTMRHFLRTTLREGVHFELVDPAPETLQNFRRLLRGTKACIEQRYSGDGCIKAFVEALGVKSVERRTA